MKKYLSFLIALIVLIIIAGGGYVLFRSPNKPAPRAPLHKVASHSVAVNNSVLITKSTPSIGGYLAEPNGTPLYTYAHDHADVSTCTGTCLASWPAYQAPSSPTQLPANVGVIKRTDNGEFQYTYKGLPLYTFVSDTNGQVTGNGVADFYVAKPSTN